MKRPLVWGLLLLISAVALALRWTGLDWDGYNHYHPDERYITWVATTIAWPDDWISAVTPHRSPLNPYYWPPNAADLTDGVVVPSDEPRAFAYGHLPLYLGVAATRLVEQMPSAWIDWVPLGSDLGRDLFNLDAKIEFRHLTAVARALTGLADVGTLLLLFLLGKRIYGSAVGLLAAAFLAVNVMHIQLAHFFISDPFLTLFVVAALFALVASLQAKRPGIWLLLGAAMVGLAVGSKFSAVMLMLPLTLAVGLVMREKWIRWLAISAVVAFLSFALTNPFALLDFSCDVVTPAMQLGPIHHDSGAGLGLLLPRQHRQAKWHGQRQCRPWLHAPISGHAALSLLPRNAAPLGHGLAARHRCVCGVCVGDCRECALLLAEMALELGRDICPDRPYPPARRAAAADLVCALFPRHW